MRNTVPTLDGPTAPKWAQCDEIQGRAEVRCIGGCHGSEGCSARALAATTHRENTTAPRGCTVRATLQAARKDGGRMAARAPRWRSAGKLYGPRWCSARAKLRAARKCGGRMAARAPRRRRGPELTLGTGETPGHAEGRWRIAARGRGGATAPR